MFDVVRKVPDGDVHLTVKEFVVLQIREDVLLVPDGMGRRLFHFGCEGSISTEIWREIDNILN